MSPSEVASGFIAHLALLQLQVCYGNNAILNDVLELSCHYTPFYRVLLNPNTLQVPIEIRYSFPWTFLDCFFNDLGALLVYYYFFPRIILWPQMGQNSVKNSKITACTTAHRIQQPTSESALTTRNAQVLGFLSTSGRRKECIGGAIPTQRDTRRSRMEKRHSDRSCETACVWSCVYAKNSPCFSKSLWNVPNLCRAWKASRRLFT